MGEKHADRDIAHGRQVAVKVLKALGIPNPGLANRVSLEFTAHGVATLTVTKIMTSEEGERVAEAMGGAVADDPIVVGG